MSRSNTRRYSLTIGRSCYKGNFDPAVPYSMQWRARLLSAQRNVQATRRTSDSGKLPQLLRDPGTNNEVNGSSPVDTVLRHFSIAQQRYDSKTGPFQKFCALFIAVGSMLAQIVDDQRMERKKRELARNVVLNHMTGAAMIAIAFASGYISGCGAFPSQIRCQQP